MSVVVCIESSTRVCSVALSQDGQCICSRELREGPSHATALAPMVAEVVSMADSHAIPIDAVAVSRGPGSYTGLRIGASIAKGLCYGRDLKFVAVDTLKTLCVPLLLYRDDLPEDALFCPMIDARRMEVYMALYDRSLRAVRATSAEVVEAGTLDEWLERGPVVLLGDGAGKCRGVLSHRNAIFVDDVVPLAKNMVPLAELQLARGETDDVASFEPFYLKEYVPTVGRRLL